MKRKLLFLLTLLLALTLITAVGCDLINTPICQHVDTNADGVCDLCKKKMPCKEHADLDNDGKCDNCGQKLTIACDEHVDLNDDNRCDKCKEYIIPPCVEHDFSDNKWFADETHHWKTCTACGEIGQKDSHEDNADNDCTTAEICRCGYVTKDAREQHQDDDEDGTCDFCPQQVTKPCTNHTFDEQPWLTDDQHHWQKCANCTTLSDKTQHDTPTNADCTQQEQCVCGHVTKQTTTHSYTNVAYQSDTDGHWQKCRNCAVTMQSQAHTPKTVTNCTNSILCSTCNYVITKGNTSHNFGGEWQKNASGHWQNCQNANCLETNTIVAHDTPTNADCTKAESCVCGYVTKQETTHVYTNQPYQSDASSHWQKCKNCAITSQVVAHTPQTVTDCTQDVLCTACDYLLTQGNDTHNFGGEWQKDTDNHWQNCQNNNCVETSAHITHNDADLSGSCDTCGIAMEIPPCVTHKDENGDGICDVCKENVPSADCTHTDSDGNGICEKCNDSVTVDVDLFAINDIHGKFLANSSQPGVGGMTTYLKQAQQNNPNTVIFSSGDSWQGSAESGLSKGKIMNDWMKEVGFAFMTLGNHEFDWGTNYIQQNVSSELPFLGINVFDTTTNKRATYAEPSVLVDLGKVQVGFIGAIGDCLSSISGEYQTGLEFKTGDELTQLIKDEADNLRSRGADIVVLSMHYDDSTYDENLSNGYVDIVFEAHTHKSYSRQDSYGVWHLQAGGENSTGLYNAKINYNVITKDFAVATPSLISKDTYGQESEHSSIATIKAQNQDAIDKAVTVIGTNSSTLDSTTLTNLVAQLYASAGEERWSSYDIVLGGGKISCRSPYNLYAGNVTYGDLYMLFPFDNRLALCSLSGSKLNSRYINNTTGDNPYVIGYTAYGKTVKDNVDSSATYYIIADSYNYTYSANGLTVVADYDQGVYARDLLAEYIANGGLNGGTGGGETTPGLQANTYYTIEQLIDFGSTLAAGTTTTDKYYTSGTIQSIKTDTNGQKYGNMYLTDGNGNTIYVYGVSLADGTLYGNMTDKPQVGDTIYLYGQLCQFSSTSGVVLEFYKATLVDISQVPTT